MSRAIAAAFDAELDATGSLTPVDVKKRYPPNAATVSVPSLEQVKFYADFAIDPAIANAEYDRLRKEAERTHGQAHVQAILNTNKHHPLRKYRRFDFRLSDQEHERLQQHGFVVSERLRAESFADMYYRMYTDDLPVFVTSDSILHAWHWSFDAFLTDLEVEELMPLLGATLAKTLAACATQCHATVACGNEAAQAALAEVELYLTTAHRLLITEDTTMSLPEPSDNESSWDRDRRRREQEAEFAYEASLGEETTLCDATNNYRLTELLETVQQELLADATILGSGRLVDFSIFKPRGHYVKLE